MAKATKSDHVNLDGAQGEGGGQILRTALTMSMTTGRPFRITNIRSKRKKPGLMRQHLTCVLAAQRVCSGRVEGATLRSTELAFEPGPVHGGDFRFAIGSAGSANLVLQTVLPALLTAKEPSTVSVEGGTHNEAAPPADFIELSYLPLLRRMGAQVEYELVRAGFYPAGGGKVVARVHPVGGLAPLELLERGEITGRRGIATVAGLSGSIALRELEVLMKKLGLSESECEIRQLDDELGPGNVVSVVLESKSITNVFASFGRRGRSAESVAQGAADDAREHVGYGAPIDRRLADQLMVPMAITGGGVFTTGPLTQHSLTNMETISAFDIASFETKSASRGIVVHVHPLERL